ncbi:MAG: thioesterase family protein [Steroidobacteraceae bacterium]
MRKSGPCSESTEVVVAFHDVDIMAVVWHGHYFKYLENARWALMDRLGYGYKVMVSSDYLWPIIETHVRHIRPARFGDRLTVMASLVEWQNRLAINYLVSDATTRERVARARTVQVAVDRATDELQFVSPASFVRQIEAGLANAKDSAQERPG